MASPQTLSRLSALIWALIFGGLFAIVFSFVFKDLGPALPRTLAVAGVVATAVGAALIYVRSRLTEDS